MEYIINYLKKKISGAGSSMIFEPAAGHMTMVFFAVTLTLTFMFSHMLRGYHRPRHDRSCRLF